jgi:hypothetical protein
VDIFGKTGSIWVGPGIDAVTLTENLCLKTNQPLPTL